jgi:hypothetical protein
LVLTTNKSGRKLKADYFRGKVLKLRKEKVEYEFLAN